MADNSSSSTSSLSSSSSGEIESPIALLEAIEAAIIKVGAMQSYRIGDRQVTYADLGDLLAMRTRLRAEVQARQHTRPPISFASLGGAF